MYHPTLEEFLDKARAGYNLIPVYRQILADLETPVGAFRKINDKEYGFLLESVEAGQLGRYSFLGSGPSVVIQTKADTVQITENETTTTHALKSRDGLEELQQLMARYRVAPEPSLPAFQGGAVGFVGYDMVHYFENIPLTGIDDHGFPDMCFMITDTILIFDHVSRMLKVVSNAHVEGDPREAYERSIRQIDELIEKINQPLLNTSFGAGRTGELVIRTNREKSDYLDAIRRCKEYILAGDIFQAIVSVRREVEIQSDPFDVYRALRTVNPSPYMFYLKMGDLHIAGSSPEILVKMEKGRVRYRPLAGTRWRGQTDEEDRQLAEGLLNDPKERAEHIMLVDLGRNDIGRVCRYGSVRVNELMTIERYSHVMHIVSNVVGEIDPQYNAFDLLRAVFPAGTVSGAPKVRAMQIIDELEPTFRGIYGGTLGYFSFSGDIDTGIILRTIAIRGRTAFVQSGGGIVADSDPDYEWNEAQNKAMGLLRALEMAEIGVNT